MIVADYLDRRSQEMREALFPRTVGAIRKSCQ